MSDTPIDLNTFAELLRKRPKNGTLHLDGINLSHLEFPVDILDSIHFSGATCTEVVATGRAFRNFVFENCTLIKSDFSKCSFEHVSFKNCTLDNVNLNKIRFDNLIFDSCELIGEDLVEQTGYREMAGDTIDITKSKITNIDLSRSRFKLNITESVLELVHGFDLKAHSSVYIENSNANKIDFSGSQLDALRVKNSCIQNSRINHANIGKITLENSDLKMPIGAGNHGMLIAKNTNNVILGKSKVKHMAISSCSNNYIIHLGDLEFDTLVVDGCNPSEFILHNSIGKRVSITNCAFTNADLGGIVFDDFTLENTSIKKKLNYQNAQVRRTNFKNIVLDHNAINASENANFKIDINT